MSAHWKHGDGFAIRYGGHRNIQWFFNENVAPGSSAPNISMALEPIGLAIEAAKAAAMFLQWWELRKQTLIQSAAFEERRIPWIIDMLATLHSDIQLGQYRLDTLLFLDRELSRYLDCIMKNGLVDLPSSLLLQIDRTARTLVDINSFVYPLVSKQRTNWVSPGLGIEAMPEYVPYYEYDKVKNVQHWEILAAFVGPVATLALPAFMPFSLAAWGAKKFFDLSKKAEETEREEEFYPMRNLLLELKSSEAIVAFSQQLPMAQEGFLPHGSEDSV
jgi:hypothetical protein